MMSYRNTLIAVVSGALLIVPITIYGLAVHSSGYYPTKTPSYHGSNNSTQYEQQIEAWWDWLSHDPVGLFTFCLLIVGILQASLFLWQLRLISKGAVETKIAANAAATSAKAAQDSIELARETAERELRAYVLVDIATFVQPRGPNWRTYINVSLKNFGQTPCYQGNLIFEADISSTKQEYLIIPFSGNAEWMPNVIIAPGHTQIISIEKTEEVSRQWDSLPGRGKTAYVWGRLEYIDAFNKRHTTEFQMFNPFLSALSFGACKVGNNAD